MISYVKGRISTTTEIYRSRNGNKSQSVTEKVQKSNFKSDRPSERINEGFFNEQIHLMKRELFFLGHNKSILQRKYILKSIE